MGKVISLDRFLETAIARRGDAAPWADALRDRGRADFAALGFPNRRVEAWKYSDLAQALRETPAETGVARSPLLLPGAFIAALENGVLDAANSSFPKSWLTPLRPVLADGASPFAGHIGRINAQKDHAIVSLNAARMEEGFVLCVPKGEALQSPLHIRYNWRSEEARAPDGRHLRILIVLEEGATATVLESHDGSPGLATIVTELRLAANAQLTHIRVEQLGAASRQSAATLGEFGASSRYRGFYLSKGGHFCRHEALFELAGEGADVQIDGAFLVAEARHCDNTTVITHAAPHTASRQAFRGVLAGEARGAYQGCVKVQPQAQKTDARQMSRALLLSRKAAIATKPELEIFADDVKCSHGATAGEIDAAALFFLRARGIPEAEARALLIEAFLGEALATIESDSLRELAASAVEDWLRAHAGEVSHAE